jgi:hypothetical protein
MESRLVRCGVHWERRSGGRESAGNSRNYPRPNPPNSPFVRSNESHEIKNVTRCHFLLQFPFCPVNSKLLSVLSTFIVMKFAQQISRGTSNLVAVGK